MKRVFTEEHKHKIGESKRGNKNMFGKKHSPETKQKMRLKALGRVVSVETREKISIAKIGTHLSEETKEKKSQSMLGKNMGPDNGMWRGGISYARLHLWVREHLPKPELCQKCGVRPPYEVSNVSPIYDPTTYTRDPKNWRWRCRRCHMEDDGRLHSFQRKRCIICEQYRVFDGSICDECYSIGKRAPT